MSNPTEHLIKLFFLIIAVSSERVAQKKCKEYAKLVYIDEASPVLRIDAGVKSVSKCGIVETPLIVGGIKVKPREFPHMAVIGYGKEPLWQCGGSVISENYILTAAHCAKSRDSGPASKIRAGLVNLKEPGAEMQERDVSEHIVHPEYKPPSRYNDIALLKVNKPLAFSADIRPACLETLSPPPGKHVIATGFGRTRYEAENGSDDLMKVTLDNIADEECGKKYQSDNQQMSKGLVNTMLCAGVMSGGKDTCQGDSGGPLHRVLIEPYCMYSILGVTSFGKFCAFKNSPAIYTKVSSYLDWIEKIVWLKNN